MPTAIARGESLSLRAGASQQHLLPSATVAAPPRPHPLAGTSLPGLHQDGPRGHVDMGCRHGETDGSSQPRSRGLAKMAQELRRATASIVHRTCQQAELEYRELNHSIRMYV